jgi:hypothetical protein
MVIRADSRVRRCEHDWIHHTSAGRVLGLATVEIQRIMDSTVYNKIPVLHTLQR